MKLDRTDGTNSIEDPIPVQSLGVILGNAETTKIAIPQSELGKSGR